MKTLLVVTWEVTSEISCLHFVPIKLVSFFGIQQPVPAAGGGGAAGRRSATAAAARAAEQAERISGLRPRPC